MAASPSITSHDDTATVIAVGVLAATLATLSHETLGHGLACVSGGGHITLLTSVWFRCSPSFTAADAGGPIGNLVAGLLAAALLRLYKPGPTVRLLLLLVTALNLFWLTGQLTLELVANRHDDWSWALQPGLAAISRPVGIVVGVGGYVLVRQSLSAVNRGQRGSQAYAIRVAYAAAAAAAVIAGLMWRAQPLRSALEGLLILGIAPLGLLSVARKTNQDVRLGSSAGSVRRSWIWIAAAAAAFGLFLLVQARGLGST